MPRLSDHLAFDRFFVGEEYPDLHKEVDRGWTSGNILAHMVTHTPFYGLLSIFPRYGPQGLSSHMWHVLVDISPLQLKDVGEHLRKFGGG